MNVQLALDRMTIPEAIEMARTVQDHVDWIEVGTSLIKEFGMDSVKAIKKAFPDKVVVADMKTFDNAKYEFELCYQAGADVATVMGAAPLVTVETCMDTAAKYGKTVMIDLLHTSADQQAYLFRYETAISCMHVSKDEQEQKGHALHSTFHAGELTALPDGLKLAVAGGITLQSLPNLLEMRPFVVIVGSAITKAANPRQAAFDIKQVLEQHKEIRING
ncbi:3-hexulose-6-phosphate synthase [Gordoniibacillus kamchatkensis]|uniref:3-hexulose-6-phosphate synthase n=1 Tax=Gordoniibacillus kamchatkensis TaxID=1590651 RepID=A0ABR5AKE7_9BACL|nr:3-hexulose-6-phosphate synthase [Paenibacillus sp. VKM B-2647]KIL41507.1 3-hexulose-6-phosphate synthase [Paenibacillus sp. VKM B-2647]